MADGAGVIVMFLAGVSNKDGILNFLALASFIKFITSLVLVSAVEIVSDDMLCDLSRIAVDGDVSLLI